MKTKKIPFVFFILSFSLFIFQVNAQTLSSVPKDGKIKVMVMEDILFSGITSSNEKELLEKKIERIDKTLVDPAQIEANTEAENDRKTALLALRNKLVEQKNKLTAPKTN